MSEESRSRLSVSVSQVSNSFLWTASTPSMYYCVQYGGDIICVFEMKSEADARKHQELLDVYACNNQLQSDIGQKNQ